MTVLEMIYQGIQLMLLGMGGVFTFLGILILAINTIASLVSALNLIEEPAANSALTRLSQLNASAGNNNELVAVISAAVGQYRSNHPVGQYQSTTAVTPVQPS